MIGASTTAAPAYAGTVLRNPIQVSVGTADVLKSQAQLNKPVSFAFDREQTWPPVLVDRFKTSSALPANGSLVGTVKRRDGHLQVTYNGWPLYWFFLDKTATDATGEGLGNNWSTIKPDGLPVFKKSN